MSDGEVALLEREPLIEPEVLDELPVWGCWVEEEEGEVVDGYWLEVDGVVDDPEVLPEPLPLVCPHAATGRIKAVAAMAEVILRVFMDLFSAGFLPVRGGAGGMVASSPARRPAKAPG